MSDNISNTDLMNVLLSLKGDVGELKGHVSGTQLILAAHILEDKALTADVQKLQFSQQRQRGFVAAVSAIGAVVGAGIGVVVDLFVRSHH
jgi:F0F1-type ATP synthase assembly protein I